MKKNIIFVDDEPRILSGIRRMFYKMKEEWNLFFADSGREALQVMEQQVMDMIVSDMRMPEMTGVELLNEVKIRYPSTIRIVLSGYSDKDMILKTVGNAHQFLSKPCDSETLKGKILQAFLLERILENRGLKEIIATVSSLPSLPRLYQELSAELRSDDPSMQKVAGIVEQDPATSAKVLQLVNSAFFGVSHRISSINEAVNHLGTEILKSLVLVSGAFSELQPRQVPSFPRDAFWNHAIRVGRYSKIIAREEGLSRKEQEESFTAGLLHDIGQLLLAAKRPHEYHKVMKLWVETGQWHWQAENCVVSTNHAVLGAYLLGIWGLPNSIVRAVLHHHQPFSFREPEETVGFDMGTAVYLAEIIDSRINGGRKKCHPVDVDYLQLAGNGGQIEFWEKICEEND